MTSAFWPALIGFALGSSQVLLIDWIRARSQHRRQLRLLRAEIRRLSGFQRPWGLQRNVVPPDDTTPIPPRITASYQRLLQEVDFWLTDEHSDDNTQQGLIDIADGAGVLERYDADVRSCSIRQSSLRHLQKERRPSVGQSTQRRFMTRNWTGGSSWLLARYLMSSGACAPPARCISWAVRSGGCQAERTRLHYRRSPTRRATCDCRLTRAWIWRRP